MLTAGRVLSIAKKGTGVTMKTIFYVLSIATASITLISLIVKAIWFRVEYGHVAVMMRNQQLKLDNHGEPIIKEPGWRKQLPIRDDFKVVKCTQQTSHLEAQNLTAGDGKNTISATIKWHTLSLRDGPQFRTYPARTLIVDDLNQEVEEQCRDAIRLVMATSKTAASQWQSKKLTKKVRRLLRDNLDLIGVTLDEVRLPEAAQSEGTAQGNLIKQGFQILAGQEPTSTYEPYRPQLEAVPD